MITHRRIVPVAAVSAALLGISLPAWAFFTAQATSNISATAARLAAVTGLGATATDANDVLVSWSPPTNPTGTTYTASTTAGTACTGTTSCTVSGLVASTAYTFTVTPTLQGWTGPAATTSASTTAAATKLSFTSTAVSGTASNSASIGPITVQEQTAAGVAAAGGSAVTVNLSSNSAGSPVFAANSNGSNITSVTIPAHSSSVSFYYGDTKAGSPTINAAAIGLGSATQIETITPATASKVVFTTQPSGAVPGTAFTGQPVAVIEDALGNVVTGSSAPISLAITGGTGTSGATLTGCSAITAGGVASFSGCKIDKAGTGYTLTASSSVGLTDATSSSFNVAVPLAIVAINTNGNSGTGTINGTAPTAVNLLICAGTATSCPGLNGTPTTEGISSDGTWSHSYNLTKNTQYTVTVTSGGNSVSKTWST